MTFYDHLHASPYTWERVGNLLADATAADVERSLAYRRRTIQDFITLISPAAIPYLEQMARQAHALTVERFGHTMQLYIPLYLSNICSNACVYCGFSRSNKIHRRRLTAEEVDREAEAILRLGYKHLLLVSGESEKATPASYYEEMTRRLRPLFSQLSLEVQPLTTEAGRKADYRYRLETPDRIGRANMQKIGIGALLGLENWRVDSVFTALHLRYLEQTYWKSKFSISLPRLRPATGGWEPKDPIDDVGMVQLITAFRLLDKDVEISLSTRESREFRDHVMPLGITSVSAGSKTEPGGYAEENADLEQFAINDARSPAEMAADLRRLGYEPVWKDWDAFM